ncbi:uncharacterized protein TRAVEDRAFT_20368 [Trametes versicolor FP-101664 SS1]|uniref:uncharacterized protein n=1 Tax=Trametes versicolor (strain FP-101664) TaxID=717944 RepID=UPI0004621710|nr:uncharacterized protein TRAVEDRAFT_20368 [Trametes versicolor FP-101664 SS1]EIW58331.1 hypothetical protein TRAVEDRAFT_20368 [Trametes versicolor FP-101664 SS1]
MDRPPQTPQFPPLAQVPPRTSASLRTSPRPAGKTRYVAPKNQLLPAYEGGELGGTFRTFTRDFQNVEQQVRTTEMRPRRVLTAVRMKSEYGSGQSTANEYFPGGLSSWEPTPSPSPRPYEQTVDFSEFMHLAGLAQQQQQSGEVENYGISNDGVGYGSTGDALDGFDLSSSSSFVTSSPKRQMGYQQQELEMNYPPLPLPSYDHAVTSLENYINPQMNAQPARKRQRVDTSLDGDLELSNQHDTINPALLQPPYQPTEQHDVPMEDDEGSDDPDQSEIDRIDRACGGYANLKQQEVPPPYPAALQNARTEREFVIEFIVLAMARNCRKQLEACIVDIPGQPLADNPIVVKLLGEEGVQALHIFPARQQAAAITEGAPPAPRMPTPQQQPAMSDRARAKQPAAALPQLQHQPMMPTAPIPSTQTTSLAMRMRANATSLSVATPSVVHEWPEQQAQDAWQQVRQDMHPPVASSSRMRTPAQVIYPPPMNAPRTYHPAARNLLSQFNQQADPGAAARPREEAPFVRTQNLRQPTPNMDPSMWNQGSANGAPVAGLSSMAQTSVSHPAHPSAQATNAAKWPMDVDWSKVPKLPPAPMKQDNSMSASVAQLWNSRRAHFAALGMPPNPQGGYPEIHLRDPDDKLRNVHKATVASWRQKPERVALEPFGQDHISDAKASETHGALNRTLKAAFGDVPFGIIPPTRTQNGVQRWEAATAWMSHSWPPVVAMLLIVQRIWIFRDISFVATADASTPPKLLLPLIGLTRWEVYAIRELVMEEFTKDKVYEDLKTLVSANQDYASFADKNVATCKVIDSLDVVVRDVVTKTKTTKVAYIYMDPPTKSSKFWVDWRDNLKVSPFSGETVRATVSRRQTRCEMCHGADHQTDQCPFPHVAGWQTVIEKRGGYKGHGGRDDESGDDNGDRASGKRKAAPPKSLGTRR